MKYLLKYQSLSLTGIFTNPNDILPFYILEAIDIQFKMYYKSACVTEIITKIEAFPFNYIEFSGAISISDIKSYIECCLFLDSNSIIFIMLCLNCEDI
jgi:hypothetical protein